MPEKAADGIISVDTTKYTKYYHLTYLLSRNYNTMLFVCGPNAADWRTAEKNIRAVLPLSI